MFWEESALSPHLCPPKASRDERPCGPHLPWGPDPNQIQQVLNRPAMWDAGPGPFRHAGCLTRSHLLDLNVQAHRRRAEAAWCSLVPGSSLSCVTSPHPYACLYTHVPSGLFSDPHPVKCQSTLSSCSSFSPTSVTTSKGLPVQVGTSVQPRNTGSILYAWWSLFQSPSLSLGNFLPSFNNIYWTSETFIHCARLGRCPGICLISPKKAFHIWILWNINCYLDKESHTPTYCPTLPWNKSRIHMWIAFASAFPYTHVRR